MKMFDSPEKKKLKALQELDRQRQHSEQLQRSFDFVQPFIQEDIEAQAAARLRRHQRRKETNDLYRELASLPDTVALIRYIHVVLERAIIEHLPYDSQIDFCDRAIDIFYQTHRQV